MVKGIVVQFRRGRHTIHERHFLLDIGLDSRNKAKELAGKEVLWTSPAGKKIKGKISDAHGNRGLVRAIFERGLPGQAITTEIEVLGVDANNLEKGEVKEIKEEKIKEDSEEKVEKKEPINKPIS